MVPSPLEWEQIYWLDRSHAPPSPVAGPWPASLHTSLELCRPQCRPETTLQTTRRREVLNAAFRAVAGSLPSGHRGLLCKMGIY